MSTDATSNVPNGTRGRTAPPPATRFGASESSGPEPAADWPVVPEEGRRRTGDLRVTYKSRPDATPAGELAALAAVYRFIIERAQRDKTAETERNGEDAGRE